MTIENETLPQQAASPPRALLYTVYIMGVILVLLFLGVIAGLYFKMKSRTSVAPPSVSVDLGLSQSQIKQMILDNGRLAVTTDSELVVIDVTTRTVIMRTPIKP